MRTIHPRKLSRSGKIHVSIGVALGMSNTVSDPGRYNGIQESCMAGMGDAVWKMSSIHTDSASVGTRMYEVKGIAQVLDVSNLQRKVSSTASPTST